MPELRVTSGEVEIFVREEGDPARPTVLLAHGYPDTSAVWRPLVDRLSDRFHVVSFDMRGFGASGSPATPEGYRLDRLVSDLGAVIDRVSPDRPVHLVGHDWGSCVGWAAVLDAALRPKVASFTTFGGVSLRHSSTITRRLLGRGPAGAAAAVRQMAASSYIAAMQIPVVPELVIDALGVSGFRRVLRAQAVPTTREHPASSLKDDLRNGLHLYRQNMLTGRDSEGPSQPGRTAVPVQLVVCSRDRYLRPALAQAQAGLAETAWVRRLATGHWAQLTRPSMLATWITEFVEAVEEQGSRLAPRQSPAFADHLVVVTGAGSGIGQATAKAFASAGARVMVADIDEAAAKHTADEIASSGGEAFVYQVDVADGEAMARFADYVRQTHGVPDVVVNNAGIAIAGLLLDLGEQEWGRITSVNLDGVYRGCRLFGRQMVERGDGGHLVNLASMAAYTPSPQLAAYAATKAAVLQLSETLRLELEEHGVGVSAICPGVINTPITRHAQYVGALREVADEMRSQSIQAFERRGYPPEKVAAAILDAVLRGRMVVPVAPEAHVGRALARFAPGVNRSMVRALRRIGPPTSAGYQELSGERGHMTSSVRREWGRVLLGDVAVRSRPGRTACW